MMETTHYHIPQGCHLHRTWNLTYSSPCSRWLTTAGKILSYKQQDKCFESAGQAITSFLFPILSGKFWNYSHKQSFPQDKDGRNKNMHTYFCIWMVIYSYTGHESKVFGYRCNLTVPTAKNCSTIDVGHLGCTAVRTYRQIKEFWRNILSSGLKSDIMFLQNAGIYIQIHAVLQTRRSTSSNLHHCENLKYEL